MKRILLLAASAILLCSTAATAQVGKQGTQRQSPGTIRGTDNRQQPGTWNTSPEERMTQPRINPGQRIEPNTRENTIPATIRSGQRAGSVNGYSPQDTIRRRRDTVEGPVPIPIPPAPVPVPIPDSIRR